MKPQTPYTPNPELARVFCGNATGPHLRSMNKIVFQCVASSLEALPIQANTVLAVVSSHANRQLRHVVVLDPWGPNAEIQALVHDLEMSGFGVYGRLGLHFTRQVMKPFKSSMPMQVFLTILLSWMVGPILQTSRSIGVHKIMC